MKATLAPSRQDFLDFACELTKDLALKVGPGEDVPMTLIFQVPDGAVGIGVVPIEANTDKDFAAHTMRVALKQHKAVYYALITAAWTVMFDLVKDKAESDRLLKIVQEHGTSHPEVRHLRREVYTVSAGDRAGCEFRIFEVRRDPDGRILELMQTREDITGSGAMRTEGRFNDLLHDDTETAH